MCKTTDDIDRQQTTDVIYVFLIQKTAGTLNLVLYLYESDMLLRFYLVPHYILQRTLRGVISCIRTGHVLSLGVRIRRFVPAISITGGHICVCWSTTPMVYLYVLFWHVGYDYNTFINDLLIIQPPDN